MLLSEFGKYLFVTIESEDWQRYGRSLLDTIKSVPGRIPSEVQEAPKEEKSA